MTNKNLFQIFRNRVEKLSENYFVDIYPEAVASHQKSPRLPGASLPKT